MQLLRHFTIRRVVLWMMIFSLAIVALAGGYGTVTLRDMYRHADRADAAADFSDAQRHRDAERHGG